MNTTNENDHPEHNNPVVLVIGDVMLDVSIEGPVTKVAQGAPVPVVKRKTVTHRAGGAANVAAGIGALGCDVNLIGVVGDDHNGVELRDLLADTEGVLANLLEHPDNPTTTKMRIVGNDQVVARVDDEIFYTGGCNLLATIDIAFRQWPIEVVVISDYGKGVISPEVMGLVKQHLKDKNGFLIVDPHPAYTSYYEGCDLITPNLEELHSMFPALLHPAVIAGDVVDKATCLALEAIEQLDIKQVLVTLGSEGMLLVSASTAAHKSAVVQDVFDVVGAGDTVVAAIASYMNYGCGLDASVDIANVAAGVAVSHHGTSVVDTKMLMKEMRQRDWRYKIISADTLDEVLEEDKITVFTNGCFDVLHPGHLGLLQEAAAQGDVLIVGVNSDESVRGLKGEGRPKINQEDRASAVAMLPFVDAVVIFYEQEPIELLKVVNPDVLVKGEEYRDTKIPGADFVAKKGGRVHFSKMVPGYSTTSLTEGHEGDPMDALEVSLLIEYPDGCRGLIATAKCRRADLGETREKLYDEHWDERADAVPIYDEKLLDPEDVEEEIGEETNV